MPTCWIRGPELAAEKAAAQLGDPPAEAGDRGPEGGAVTVAAAAAVELELVAVVRADVGVVAREGDRFAHFRPFPTHSTATAYAISRTSLHLPGPIIALLVVEVGAQFVRLCAVL